MTRRLEPELEMGCSSASLAGAHQAQASLDGTCVYQQPESPHYRPLLPTRPDLLLIPPPSFQSHPGALPQIPGFQHSEQQSGPGSEIRHGRSQDCGALWVVEGSRERALGQETVLRMEGESCGSLLCDHDRGVYLKWDMHQGNASHHEPCLLMCP